jgi:hypothetical protein
MIRGAPVGPAFNAARSSARVRTTNTWAASALAPPRVSYFPSNNVFRRYIVWLLLERGERLHTKQTYAFDVDFQVVRDPITTYAPNKVCDRNMNEIAASSNCASASD